MNKNIKLTINVTTCGYCQPKDKLTNVFHFVEKVAPNFNVNTLLNLLHVCYTCKDNSSLFFIYKIVCSPMELNRIESELIIYSWHPSGILSLFQWELLVDIATTN